MLLSCCCRVVVVSIWLTVVLMCFGHKSAGGRVGMVKGVRTIRTRKLIVTTCHPLHRCRFVTGHDLVTRVPATRPVEFPMGCHNPCHSLVIFHFRRFSPLNFCSSESIVKEGVPNDITTNINHLSTCSESCQYIMS